MDSRQINTEQTISTEKIGIWLVAKTTPAAYCLIPTLLFTQLTRKCFLTSKELEMRALVPSYSPV